MDVQTSMATSAESQRGHAGQFDVHGVHVLPHRYCGETEKGKDFPLYPEAERKFIIRVESAPYIIVHDRDKDFFWLSGIYIVMSGRYRRENSQRPCTSTTN